MITFAALTESMPPEALRWEGFSTPLFLNLNAITGDELTPESSPLEALGRLLDALHQLQNQINQTRATQFPPLPPIQLVTKMIDGNANGNPVFSWTLSIEVDAAQSLNAPVNPLQE
jgi:hypothetical protein